MEVLGLVSGAEARARLGSAVRGRGTLWFCRRVAELVAKVECDGPAALVVEPWDVDGIATAPTVSRLRRERPSMAVIACCHLVPEAAREVLRLGRAGVDDVILLGHDDVWAKLRPLLSRGGGNEERIAAALGELAPFLPAAALPVVACCLRHAHEPFSVEQLAREQRVCRRMLGYRLAAIGLPPPGALISYCRLIMTALSWQEFGGSVELVASAAGYGSAAALRRVLRRYTGQPVSAIRERGSSAVSGALVRLLAAHNVGQTIEGCSRPAG